MLNKCCCSNICTCGGSTCVHDGSFRICTMSLQLGTCTWRCSIEQVDVSARSDDLINESRNAMCGHLHVSHILHVSSYVYNAVRAVRIHRIQAANFALQKSFANAKTSCRFIVVNFDGDPADMHRKGNCISSTLAHDVLRPRCSGASLASQPIRAGIYALSYTT